MLLAFVVKCQNPKEQGVSLITSKVGRGPSSPPFTKLKAPYVDMLSSFVQPIFFFNWKIINPSR
jgi:hypothetical protein